MHCHCANHRKPSHSDALPLLKPSQTIANYRKPSQTIALFLNPAHSPLQISRRCLASLCIDGRPLRGRWLQQGSLRTRYVETEACRCQATFCDGRRLSPHVELQEGHSRNPHNTESYTITGESQLVFDSNSIPEHSHCLQSIHIYMHSYEISLCVSVFRNPQSHYSGFQCVSELVIASACSGASLTHACCGRLTWQKEKDWQT
jgi:hypothetical protein